MFLIHSQVNPFWALASVIIVLGLVLPPQQSSVVEAFASRNNNTKRKRLKPLRKRSPKHKLQVENSLKKQQNYKFIIGSDESGRGCIAGPVVCASCCCLVDTDDDHLLLLSKIFESIPEEVDDSKRLSKESRNLIFQQISANTPDIFIWSVATRSSQYIDETSLEQATMECFKETIESIVEQIQQLEQQQQQKSVDSRDQDQEEEATTPVVQLTDFYSIVDGHKRPAKLSIKSRPMKGGDEMVYTVALASIIARYHHEQIMSELNTKYPQYLFDTHGGYPSRTHIQALHTHGPISSIHRKSCKPVQGR